MECKIVGGFSFTVFYIVIVLSLQASSLQAYKFPIGGKDGWVLNPSENFNRWASRNRFQVNDTLCELLSLVYIYIKKIKNWSFWINFHFKFQIHISADFKYKQGSNSVLVVSKEDYYSCNTKNPLMSLTEGDSIVKLDRSGPFYFISGNADNCQKGQKLIVVVLTTRDNQKHHRTITSPQHSPSSLPQPPTIALSPGPTIVNPSDLGAPTPSPPQKSGVKGAVETSLFGFVKCVGLGVSLVLGTFV